MDFCSNHCEIYTDYSNLNTEKEKFDYLKSKISQSI